MRVLLVEDDASGRQLLTMVLEAEGHSVDAVSLGRTAIAAANRQRPDVLITDLTLADESSGFDLIEQFRADESLRSTRIVVVTGAATVADSRMALACGADVCLVKPVDVAELRSVVGSAAVTER